jgi:hypothetical protein
MGTENEKSKTPRKAHAKPVRTEALRCEAGTYETGRLNRHRRVGTGVRSRLGASLIFVTTPTNDALG